jgi:hypothetical protein
MYTLERFNRSELSLSLINLMLLSPQKSFYTNEKPPLVLTYKECVYWIEIQIPSQHQDCLVKSVETVDQLLNTIVTYHQLHTAHPVIQALFIARSREFLGQNNTATQLIPFFQHPSSHLEKKYRAISKLPHPLLQFMRDKQYSLKQCHYFCRFDSNFLNTIVEWLLPLSPTSSQLKKCVQILFDITKRESHSIMDIKLALSDTTMAGLLTTLSYRYQPTLTKRNHKMDMIKTQYHIPVTWDSTLEKQELSFTPVIRSDTDFETFKVWVNQPRAREGIQKLLDLL